MRSVRAALAVAGLLSFGCVEPAAPPPPPEPVTFGIIAETDWDGPVQAGGLVAANRINSAGGLLGGRPVRVESRFFSAALDSQMTELIDDFQIAGLVGPYNSQSATYETQLTTYETEVVQILPSFVLADPIYEAQPADDRYLYILGPPASGGGWAAFGDAIVGEGCMNVGVIAGPSAAIILESTVVPRLIAAGGSYTRILRTTSYDDPTFIRLTQAAGYDCILLILDTVNSSTFVRAWFAEPDAPPVRFGGLDYFMLPAFFEGIPDPDVLDGSMALSFSYPDPARPSYVEFKQEIDAVLGGPMDDGTIAVAAGVYDAIVLTALAVERAGATRGPAVRDALVESSRPDGVVVGPLELSEGLRLSRESMQVDYDGALSAVDIVGTSGYAARRFAFLRYEAPQGWTYVRAL